MTTGAAGDVTTAYWVGPPVGSWSSASSWSPLGVPNNNGGNLFDVVIDPEARQNSTVTQSGTIQVQNMWVTSGDALFIADNSALRLAGEHTTVDGALTISSVGNTTDLRLDASHVIGGVGVLAGSNTLANRLYGVSGGVRLTVGADLLIAGSLQLGINQLLLTNHGVIDATTGGGLYVDLTDAGPNYNDGTMRASNGATLTIFAGLIDNTGGDIEASAGSSVVLSNGSISGGTLRDADGSGAGLVRTAGTCALAHVTVEGAFSCSDNTQTNLYDGIDLQGPLQISSVGNTTDVRIMTTPFPLAGAGGVVGSNTLANRLYGVGGTTELVVAADCSITGSLQLGVNQLRLTNHGLIDATTGSGLYVDLTDAGPNVNDGTMRASNGATLTIFAGLIDNTGGDIEASAGSSVVLSNGSISGGTLRDADGSGAGLVRTAGTCALAHVTVEGAFACSDNTLTNLYDGISLQGPLKISSVGNTTDVRIMTSPFTLAGAGGVVGSNTLANRLYGVGGTTELVVAADCSITGSLQLGVNQMRLTNHGLIDATTSSGLHIDLADAGPNSNDGTMRASNGATLTISAGLIDNTGGDIEASAGSSVVLSNGSIAGGTLRDADGSGAGLVRTAGTCALAHVTVEGGYTCSDNTQTNLYDGIDLQGPLQISSIGNTTDVRIMTSPFTLAGPGGTAASNTQANRLYGINSSVQLIIGPGHTFRGACQIGANQTAIRNEGTILADASSGITIDATDATGFTNVGSLELVSGNVHIANGAFDNQGTVRIDAGRLLSRTGVYTQTAGATTVNGALAATSGVSLLGGTLGGNGQVTTLVTNTGGTVAPGNSAGSLALAQGYAQGANGSLAVEVGGPESGTEHDLLAITGGASLSGTLSVARIGGFTPTNDQVFTILTCTGARTGTFLAVESCDSVNVIYGPNSVAVQFTGALGQPADLNHDGLVNGADLGMLLSNWGPCEDACCSGDLNGDSTVDGADLGTLLASWN